MKTARNAEIAARYQAGERKADLGQEDERCRRSVDRIIRRQRDGEPRFQPPDSEDWLLAPLAPYEDETVWEWMTRQRRAWQEARG